MDTIRKIDAVTIEVTKQPPPEVVVYDLDSLVRNRQSLIEQKKVLATRFQEEDAAVDAQISEVDAILSEAAKIADPVISATPAQL